MPVIYKKDLGIKRPIAKEPLGTPTAAAVQSFPGGVSGATQFVHGGGKMVKDHPSFVPHSSHTDIGFRHAVNVTQPQAEPALKGVKGALEEIKRGYKAKSKGIRLG